MACTDDDAPAEMEDKSSWYGQAADYWKVRAADYWKVRNTGAVSWRNDQYRFGHFASLFEIFARKINLVKDGAC